MTQSTISALVVARNEDVMLEKCLSSLEWVNQIIVVLEEFNENSRLVVSKFNGQIVNGVWSHEGLIPNPDIDLSCSDWILEVNVDDLVTCDLKEEIIEKVNNPTSNFYIVKVNHYIGDKLVSRGWAGNPLGKQRYYGLYKKGAKLPGLQRNNLEENIEEPNFELILKYPIVSKKYENISKILSVLDFYTTLQAKHLAEKGGITSLLFSALKFLFSFIKVYFRFGSFREGGYGFILAICVGLYPLISSVKAIYEEEPQKELN